MAADVDIITAEGRLRLAGRGPGEMAYLDFGPSGRPFDAVFLHANGFNAYTYRRILAPLGDRYRILAIDQRGHGRTTLTAAPEGRRDWLDLRDDLLALFELLDLHDVVVAGHSMGGAVGLLASVEVERRLRLVLFDPVITRRQSGGVDMESPLARGAMRRRAVFASRADAIASYRGRGAFRTWPDTTLLDYVTQGFKDLPSGEVELACSPEWEASGYTAHEHDALGALLRARSQIDILRAETGSTCRIDADDHLDPARVRVVTVAGSTHFLPMERPDLVRAHIAAAIEDSRGAAAIEDDRG